MYQKFKTVFKNVRQSECRHLSVMLVLVLVICLLTPPLQLCDGDDGICGRPSFGYK